MKKKFVATTLILAFLILAIFATYQVEPASAFPDTGPWGWDHVDDVFGTVTEFSVSTTLSGGSGDFQRCYCTQQAVNDYYHDDASVSSTFYLPSGLYMSTHLQAQLWRRTFGAWQWIKTQDWYLWGLGDTYITAQADDWSGGGADPLSLINLGWNGAIYDDYWANQGWAGYSRTVTYLVRWAYDESYACESYHGQITHDETGGLNNYFNCRDDATAGTFDVFTYWEDVYGWAGSEYWYPSVYDVRDGNYAHVWANGTNSHYMHGMRLDVLAGDEVYVYADCVSTSGRVDFFVFNSVLNDWQSVGTCYMVGAWGPCWYDIGTAPCDAWAGNCIITFSDQNGAYPTDCYVDALQCARTHLPP